MRFNNNQLIIFVITIKHRSNWKSDELMHNASDNDAAPESPILLQMECDSIIIKKTISIDKLSLRFNWVSDELTLNASDNDVAPESPILLQIQCNSIIIH